MAKDRIDRTGQGEVEASLAGAGKTVEVDTLLKKKLLGEDEQHQAKAGEQSPDASQDAQAAPEGAPVAAADGEKAEGEQTASADNVQVAAADSVFASDAAPVMVASLADGGAVSGGSSTGMSTGTMLAIGGVALVGGGIAIAASNGGGGHHENNEDGEVLKIETVPAGVTSVAEGQQIVFKITGDPGSTVSFALSGTAGPSDYTVQPNNGTVTFDANGTAFVTVTTLNDNVVENGETIILNAGAMTSPTITVTDLAPGTFILTNDTDIATATNFFAPQVYTPGGDDRINSLQNEDVLTGNSDHDVLTATLGNANDNGAQTITPTLNGIETVNADFSSNFDLTLDVQDSTGIKAINVTRIDDSITATVRNIDDTTTNLSVSNSSALSDVVLDYRNNSLQSNADAVGLILDNVLLNSLSVGDTDNFTPTRQQIETLNIGIKSFSQVGNLNTGASATPIQGVAQTLNINLQSNFIIGKDVDDNGTVLNDGDQTGADPLVAGAGISNINVTGTGDIQLGEVGSYKGFQLNSTTLVGKTDANITNAAGDYTAGFHTGAGDDFLYSTKNLLGDITTLGGADRVTIIGDLAIKVVGGAVQTSSVDTGDGNDTAVITGDLQGSVGGGATLTLGAGDDVAKIGGPLDNDDPVDYDIVQILVPGGTTTAVTDPNLQLVFGPSGGDIGEEASILGGDGKDVVTLAGSILGDTPEATEDDIGGLVDLGAGDDTLIFDQTAGAGGTLVLGKAAGGAGNNVLTVDGNASANVVNVADGDDADSDIDVLITGFQTVNLISEQSINYGYKWTDANANGKIDAGEITTNGNSVIKAVEAAQADAAGTLLQRPGVNDTDSSTADYVLDLIATSDIATINIENQAGVLDLLPEEGGSYLIEGDTADYSILNLKGTETINVTTVETLSDAKGTRDVNFINSSGDSTPATEDAVLKDVVLAEDLATVTPGTFSSKTLFQAANLFFGDTTADANLFVSLQDGTGTADKLALSLAGAGDLYVDDEGNGTDGAGNYESLVITTDNSTASDYSQGVRAIEVDSDNGTAFATSFTLQGKSTDAFVVGGLESKSITTTVAGDVTLEVVADQDYTVSTGAGNDVLDLTNDTVSSGDTIDLGGGRNTLIVSNSTRTGGPDSDETFNNIRHTQILEIRGGSDFTLDDDAQDAGVDTVVLAGVDDNNLTNYFANPFGIDVNVDLDIGPDFENDLTLFIRGGSTLDLDNQNDVDLTFNINADILAPFVPDPTKITLTDAGKGNVQFNIVVDNEQQVISDFANGGGNNNDVTIDNLDATAEIDKIVLLDSNVALIKGNGNAEQEGQITLIASDKWAQPGDTLTIDASDIDDDDGTNDDNPLSPTFDDSDTQTGAFDLRAATYLVDLKATQLNDIIIGSNQADKIDGQAGEDIIFGGLGADTLTGGAGNDVFVYGAKAAFLGNTVAQQESNPTTTDTITDFKTGSDHIFVGVTLSTDGVDLGTGSHVDDDNIVNFGRFASVANAALGDDSLDGNNTTRIIGDHYYSSGEGRYAVDIDGNGDITTGDLAINVGTVAAPDVSFVIDTGSGKDLIRGGQGPDQIDAGDDDDKIVVVGSIDSAQAGAYISDAGLGATLTAEGIDKVLNETELETTRTQSEISTFTFQGILAAEQIDGGNGTDDLYAFGNVNFLSVTINDVENLVVGSQVKITQDQFSNFSEIRFIGSSDHQLLVYGAGVDGKYGTADDNLLDKATIQGLLGGTDLVLDGTGKVTINNIAAGDLLTDEGNDLTITVQDGDGVTNLVESGALTVDLSGIDSDVNKVQITVSDSGNAHTKVYDVNLASLTNGAGSVVLDLTGTAFNQGNLNFLVTQTDTANNQASNLDTSTLDTTTDAGTALTADFTGIGDNYINATEAAALRTVHLAGLDTDIASVTVKVLDVLNGADTVTFDPLGSATADPQLNLAGLVAGALTIQVTLTDDAGNTTVSNFTADPVGQNQGNTNSTSATLDLSADLGTAVAITIVDPSPSSANVVNLAEGNNLIVKVSGLDADFDSGSAVLKVDDDNNLNFQSATGVFQSFDPNTGVATFKVDISGVTGITQTANLYTSLTFNDNAGNAYNGTYSNHGAGVLNSVGFDDTVPSLIGVKFGSDPGNDAKDATVNAGNPVVLTFDTSSLTIADASQIHVFTATGVNLDSSFALSVTNAGQSLTFSVTAPGNFGEIQGGDDYYITIGAGGLTDAAGNPYAGNTAGLGAGGIHWDAA